MPWWLVSVSIKWFFTNSKVFLSQVHSTCSVVSSSFLQIEHSTIFVIFGVVRFYIAHIMVGRANITFFMVAS